MRKYYQEWTDKRRREAARLYLEGHTIAQTAEEMHTGVRHVLAALAALGVQTRKAKDLCAGAGNPAWKGGRTIDKDGYALVWYPQHPHSDHAGRVREHRLVMEQALGRYLKPNEVVHHIDGDHQNNVIENLEVYSSNAEHLSKELAGRRPDWSEAGFEKILDVLSRARARQRQKRRMTRAGQSFSTRSA